MADETVDFSRIIHDLIKAGWRETAIAKAVGVTQSNISQIKHGKIKNPKYNIGDALVGLHKKEMRKYEDRVKGPKSAATG